MLFNLETQTSDASSARGWFKAMRGDEAMELIRHNPNAFTLAYIIAWRARYRPGFSAGGLEPGEALLGDHANCGMTMRQYRTAKEQLTRWRFATFRTTSKGTIGMLLDTRLFDPLNLSGDNQNGSQATDERRPADNQATTNKKEKKEEEGKKSALTPFAEVPGWEEFWEYCRSPHCGLAAEWYARDKWEAACMENWRRMPNWQAYARRCKGWWEADGRPTTPPLMGNSRNNFGKPQLKPDHSKGF